MRHEDTAFASSSYFFKVVTTLMLSIRRLQGRSNSNIASQLTRFTYHFDLLYQGHENFKTQKFTIRIKPELQSSPLALFNVANQA